MSAALALDLDDSTPAGADVLLVFRDLNRAQQLADALRRRDLDAGLSTYTDVLVDLEHNPAKLVVTDWPLRPIDQCALDQFMNLAARRPVMIRPVPRSDFGIRHVADEIAEACRYWRAATQAELEAQALAALARESVGAPVPPASGPRLV